MLSVVPILLMASRVSGSTKLNYLDYWSAMLRITNPDGSVRVRGFFTYQNEHPFVIPQLIYYIDAKYFGGSNQHLGYYSIVMSVLAVALLGKFLPRDWPALSRAGLLLFAAVVMFCPAGAWNYVRGMSGVAWLTANVFALTAVYFASRGRTIPAVIAAALALVTYGTGFGAPVAIIAVALLRRDRWYKWALPSAELLGALVVYKLTAHGGSAGHPSHDPALLLQTFLTNLATIWTNEGGSMAVLIGMAGALLLGYAFSRYWPDRDAKQSLIPWWGIAAYTVVAAGLISIGRSDVFSGNGSQGRYVSLCALFWISVVVVSFATIRVSGQGRVRAVLIAALAAVFWAESPGALDTATAQSALQDELAAGLRFNAVDPFGQIMDAPSQQISRLRNLHAYPFTSGYTLGCGIRPGDTIDPNAVKTLPSAMFPGLGSEDKDTVIGSTRQVSGWIYRAGDPTRCVLFIDGSGKVVGGGSPSVPRSDVTGFNPALPLHSGFEAVTPSAQAKATLILGFADGYWQLPSNAMPAVAAK